MFNKVERTYFLNSQSKAKYEKKQPFKKRKVVLLAGKEREK